MAQILEIDVCVGAWHSLCTSRFRLLRSRIVFDKTNIGLPTPSCLVWLSVFTIGFSLLHQKLCLDCNWQGRSTEWTLCLLATCTTKNGRFPCAIRRSFQALPTILTPTLTLAHPFTLSVAILVTRRKRTTSTGLSTRGPLGEATRLGMHIWSPWMQVRATLRVACGGFIGTIELCRYSFAQFTNFTAIRTRIGICLALDLSHQCNGGMWPCRCFLETDLC